MSLESLLKSMIRKRYKDDLHSSMCYFESGRVAYIYANLDKSLSVDIIDEGIHLNHISVEEVLSMFEGDKISDYSM